MRTSARVAVVGVVGASGAACVAGAAGWLARDTVATVAIGATSGLVAAFGGAFVLRRCRGRSTRTQALVVAWSAVAVLVVGILFSAVTMSISSGDLAALAVVVSVSAAIAVGGAFQMGDDMAGATSGVVDLAERLVAGEPLESAPGDGPAEIRELADLLVELSHRLDDSRRRERSLASSRRELIAWVSHDLRSPLATIRAMAEALDDAVVADPGTVGRYHSQIRRDAERLTALVDDLFELSRSNSGSLELIRRPVCLAQVVDDAVAAARTHAALKGVRLVDEVESLPSVEVAAQEVTRVLHDLLDNAIRHTPAGGEVVVRVHTDRGLATVVVADQCGGVPEPDLSRVFDVAFRHHAVRSRDERGGGLGLAIAKGLGEAYEGSVVARNDGEGCRVEISFPLGCDS